MLWRYLWLLCVIAQRACMHGGGVRCMHGGGVRCMHCAYALEVFVAALCHCPASMHAWWRGSMHALRSGSTPGAPRVSVVL